MLHGLASLPDAFNPPSGPSTHARPIPAKSSEEARKRRVLIVDDDLGTRETFTWVLRDAGFSVTAAESGEEALALVPRASFDVVLLDLRLGEGRMDGLAVLERFQDLGVPARIVVVTGFGSVKSLKEATKLGAVDYVEKPLDGDIVVRTVERALAARPVAPVDRETPIAHPAARWAEAVVQILTAQEDPRTLAGWSRVCHASVGTLRNYCYRAHLSPKRSLDLGRVLRAASRARSSGLPVEQLLDVVDRRTLERLILSGGVPASGPLPTLDELLACQSLITDLVALRELLRVLPESTRTVGH